MYTSWRCYLWANLHIIQDSRYAKQDGWELEDISLCSSGNIAVSGHRPYRYQSYVCIYGSTVDNSDSRDKPTLLYHKQFTDKLPWRRRCISFIKPNSTAIVTCRDDEVQVIDYNRDVVLRSRKVNGRTTCLSVSGSQIFIRLWMSDIVNIYDNDLNRIKSIRLKGIRRYDWPRDITAAADRLYVCPVFNDRAIVYSQDSGSILTEYTTGQYGSEAWSMAVNIQHQIVAVLWMIDWSKKQVAVYSFNSSNCLVVFNVESGVSRIRISDQGRIVTGNEDTGEVKVFSLTQFFTYDNLKVTLSSLLSDSDQEELVKYFKISDDSLKDDRDHSNDSDDSDDSDDSEDSDGMGDGKKKKARLLTILEKKGLLQDRNFQDLKQAFSHLGIWNTSIVMSHIDFYQQHTEKNASSYLQTSEDNESGGKLQLDRFSANWSACDLSTCGNMVVVAGYCSNPDKTSLDFACKSDSNSWSPWVKTKGFEGVSKSKRIVSFINEHKVVTCCGNVIEIINCDTYETEMKQILQSSDSIATCVTVRKGDVYIGFKKSTKILVLSRELQDKMTVTLNDTKSMWPMDLAALSGKLLVCLTDNSSSQVILCNEENGQTLIEYRNVEDGNETPQSVAACEETDLVGILWPTDAEYYDGEPYGHIALYSLTHGYCLSLVAVSFTVHDFECDCYQGCSSGKRLRLTSEHAVVMDDLGGIKLFSMDQIISFDTWKSGFAHSFSLFEYEMLIAFYQLSIDEIIDKMDEEDLRGGNITAEGKIKSTMRILTAKGYITSTNVTTLKNAFAGLGKVYVDRLHQPLDAYIKYASETCITERPDSVLSGPSDSIVESLLQLQHSVQSHNTCVNTVHQQGNLSQSYRGQSSSQGQVLSSLPYTNNVPVTESLVHGAGKRAHAEGDHSATDNGLHEKRAKTGEKEPGANGHMNSTDAGTGETSNTNLSQLITQIHQTPSLLQLMEGDPPPIPTNPRVYRPVTPARSTRPTLLETLPLQMAAQPTISHQSSVDATSHQMSIIQVGLQHINQVPNTPYQVGEDVQSQTNLHVGCPTSVSQSHVPIMTQQQIMRQAIQPNIPHVPPQPRYSTLPFYRQSILSPQLQPVGQPITQQRGPCVMPNLPTSSYHQNGRSQRQGVFQELRQNVVQQQTQNSVHSLVSSVAEVVNPNTGPNTGDFASNAMSQSPHQSARDKSNQVEQREHLNAQGNIQQMLQLEPPNSVSHEVQATGRGVEQLQSTIQPGTQHSIGQTNRTEWESVLTTSQQISKEMTSVVQSCVQRVVTPLLKDISDKLGHLLGSSSTVYSQQDIPGTSSQSNNNALDSAAHSSHSRDSEHDEEVTSAWESLSEYNRMSLQAFRGMTDDRAELVRRLVEMVFTEDERRNQNCFGKSGKQKLDENKLRKIRHITFYLCPIITKKTDIDKLSLEDVEWKRLCEVIDKANRHFREKLKRQGRER